MAYKRNLAQPVSESGTGVTTMTTAYAPVCAGTTATGPLQVASTGLGTAGNVLTSTGASSLPTFQALPAGSVTITGDSGSATGSNITLTGSTSGAVFTGAGSTVTESFNYLALPTTTSTNGQIRINGSPVLHAYGTNNFYAGTSAGNFTLTGASNTAVGVNALDADTSGGFNTAVGHDALTALTTGTVNVAIGASALATSTADSYNTAVGTSSLTACNGSIYNSALGYRSGYSVSTANGGHTCIGFQTGYGITTGSYNTAVGFDAYGIGSSNGSYNTGIGYISLKGLGTGINNTALGAYSASLYTTTESNNIIIGHPGVNGESNNLRIGNGTGAGAFQLAKAFIAGIRGVTTDVNDAVAVLIDSAGQLGTTSSSIRYKENVQDMADSSSDLLKLRPVTFDFIGKPSHKRQVGLIAEEVYEIMPDLVVHNIDGEIESVKYHDLPALLLNELQKAVKRIEVLEAKVSACCGERK